MSESSQKKYTVRDYELLPEGSPYQLINGDLVMTPAPTTYHQIILMNLSNEIYNYVRKHKLGQVIVSPVDVYFSDVETYQPDIVFIRNENLKIIGEKRIEAAPDLIIEILSESTAYYDLKHKKNVYEKTGVKEYWIVDPMDKNIETYENVNKEFIKLQKANINDVIKSKVITGFALSAGEIF